MMYGVLPFLQVIARKTFALLVVVSLALLCGGDLLIAGARACGDHPCCAKGACKMMPKNGARLDRCGDAQQAKTPDVAPMVLASAAASWRLAVGGWQSTTVASTVHDGAILGVDRPPRG
jgi:hypothetical protein